MFSLEIWNLFYNHSLQATPLNTWDDVDSSSIDSNEIRNEASLEIPATQKIRNAFLELTKDFLTYSSIGFQHHHQGCVVPNATYRNGPKITSPEPKFTLLSESLPKSWDWRNINGINYLSWTINQHIPIYCGSCWAQATTSALADRFIIADKDKYANLALSPQVIINCRAGGSCEGGNPPDVYEFAHLIGVGNLASFVVLLNKQISFSI